MRARSYIRSMLAKAGHPSDAMVIKAAIYTYPKEEWEQLWEIDHMLHVQRVASETRSGVQKMGRRLLQLSRSMYPELNWQPLDEAVMRGDAARNHPIVHGWVSYHLGVPLHQAAEGYLYSCIMTCINSALRLMSMGQTQGQMLLSEAGSFDWKRVAASCTHGSLGCVYEFTSR